jgi:hypothetical protein
VRIDRTCGTSIDDESAARCGRHLTRIFTEQTASFPKRLPDRREQLAALHDPVVDQVKTGRNFFGEIMLLVDDGPSPELDAALPEAERQCDHKTAPRHGTGGACDHSLLLEK